MTSREKILKLLDEHRLSRSEVAKAIGVAYSTFMTYIDLKKPRMPMAATGVAIAEHLNVPAEWLWNDARTWPPPKYSYAGSLTNMEIVKELARRRELVFRDMYEIEGRLPQQRLENLAELAAHGHRSAAEEEELDAGLNDLFYLEMLARQLHWLDPDEVHPPQQPAQAGTFLAERYPPLREAMKQKLGQERPLIHPHVAAASGIFPRGLTWPVYQRLGDTVSENTYLTMGGPQRRLYIPILRHVTLGRSDRSLRTGSYPPGEADEYLRYDTDTSTAFACRIQEENLEPDYPQGTIAVCEPGCWETRPGDLCVALLEGTPGHGVFVFEGTTLASVNPDFESIKLEPKLDARIYRVVTTFPQAIENDGK